MAAGFYFWGWQPYLVGWGFFISGIGFLILQFFPAAYWNSCFAFIQSAKTTGDGVVAKFTYEVGGKSYNGQTDCLTFARPGDRIEIRVNPKKPSQYAHVHFLPIILGIVFAIVGLALASGSIPMAKPS